MFYRRQFGNACDGVYEITKAIAMQTFYQVDTETH